MRQWRRHKNISQLELAMSADTSQRHVSFVESGRTIPSREMVLTLAEALDLPLRARNELLLSAGYAPLYPERPLSSNELSLPRKMLARMLAHHEPYPAIVLDVGWNVVIQNRAAANIIARCVPADVVRKLTSPQGVNFLRLMCARDGMRTRIRNWSHVGRALMSRVRREALSHPGSPSERLLRELLADKLFPSFDANDAPLEAVMAIELGLANDCLRLFNTLTTFGTPQDVVLQELRIEMSFPADDTSAAILRRWAESPDPARPTLAAEV